MGLCALGGDGGSLGLESLAGVVGTLGVHGALESITLPAEEVISVKAKTSLVTHAPEEGLRAILGPLRLVVEGSSVVPGTVSLVLGEIYGDMALETYMISYMTWGILTGWVDGQAPPDSKVPD